MRAWSLLTILFHSPWVAIACATAALVVLIRSLRGRRLDDHPLCRRCKFDLTGLPPSSPRCPECGADLAPARAIVRGHRGPHRPRTTAAALALLFSLGWLAAILTTTAAGDRLTPHKPLLWLRLDIARGDPPARDAAIAEIHARLAAGAIRTTDVTPVVDDVLAIQADPAANWSPAFGDFVETLRTARGVTDVQWARYAAQAVTPVPRVRPRVQVGHPAALEIARRVRAARHSRLRYRQNYTVSYDDELPPDGQPIHLGPTPLSIDTGPVPMTIGASYGRRAPLPPGRHSLTVTVIYPLTDNPTGNAPDLASPTRTFTLPFTVTPDPTVTVSPDLLTTAAVNANLLVDVDGSESSDGDALFAHLRFRTPVPADLAWAAAFRFDGREVPAGEVTFRAGKSSGYGVRAVLGPHRPDSVDLVLRPDPAAAARTIDITRIPAGEIIVPSLPVKWPPPRPRFAPRGRTASSAPSSR